MDKKGACARILLKGDLLYGNRNRKDRHIADSRYVTESAMKLAPIPVEESY